MKALALLALCSCGIDLSPTKQQLCITTHVQDALVDAGCFPPTVPCDVDGGLLYLEPGNYPVCQ
jgi:hypothetical protein